MFLKTIPYNFYALTTLLMVILITILKVDFGPMKTHEKNAINGDIFTTAARPYGNADEEPTSPKGSVIDLVFPVAILIICCIIGMIYTGGFFEGESFVDAFANADASMGLVFGSIVTLIITFCFYMTRNVMSFKEFTDCIPEGFKAMVAPILILTMAWTLSGMTGLLGAKFFVHDLVEASAGDIKMFLPAIIFLVAVFLAFSTGTSWGTFAILIPIVCNVFGEGSYEMLVISIAACLSGAVCGDHCSPISDTTIMASAGAQCNHVMHVNTQLPYALLVAAVSFISYAIAPFVGAAWLSLLIAVALMLVTLFFMRLVMRGAVTDDMLPVIFRRFSQTVGAGTLSVALNRMARNMLEDGRIDMAEAGQLRQLLEGFEGQEEFRKALDAARADGVITLEESASIEAFLRKFVMSR